MKIIEQSVNVWPYDIPIMERIEKAGRICYKSEDKIKEGTAEKFIGNLIKRGHESVLEHGVYILELDHRDWLDLCFFRIHLEGSDGYTCYLNFTEDGRHLVSGNVRAFRDFMKAAVKAANAVPMCLYCLVKDNPVLFPEFLSVSFVGKTEGKIITYKDLITRNEKLKHFYITADFITDRAITHNIVRHRPAAYSQESTRYCNYSKDKFGGEIVCIKPDFLKPNTFAYRTWKNALERAETAYFDLLDEGLSPEEARAVLLNSLKTELVMTANIAEWRHFIKLRGSEAAHPQIRKLAKFLLIQFKLDIPDMFEDIKL